MATLEERVRALEQDVHDLKGREGVRRTLSRYAVGVDEKRRDVLTEIFAADATLLVPAWSVDARGRDAVLGFFEEYWSRFRNPRRYYANEDITVGGSSAEAFTYWHVTQEREAKSVLAWGTYEWAFRWEGGIWRITREVVNILTMTTLDRGWAVADRVMAL